MSECSFIDLPNGNRIAYHLTDGALPGIVFLGGFRSDMTGSKAMALEAYCRARGQRFLRLDYSGHGQSGGDFKNGSIGGWAEDAKGVIDKVAPGKNILVGSSMGGWIMLLIALARKEHVVGLVGIASAPDFTEKLIWQAFTPAQQQELLEKGFFAVPDCYGTEPYILTRKLIEEGRNHLLLDGPIDLQLPVRLVHGVEDKDVPWNIAVALMQKLTSENVQLTLVKNGGHRLSEPSELSLITEVLEGLLASL